MTTARLGRHRIQIGPLEVDGRTALTAPHPTEAHRRPHSLPPDNFKHSLTLFSKSFSSSSQYFVRHDGLTPSPFRGLGPVRPQDASTTIQPEAPILNLAAPARHSIGESLCSPLVASGELALKDSWFTDSRNSQSIAFRHALHRRRAEISAAGVALTYCNTTQPDAHHLWPAMLDSLEFLAPPVSRLARKVRQRHPAGPKSHARRFAGPRLAVFYVHGSLTRVVSTMILPQFTYETLLLTLLPLNDKVLDLDVSRNLPRRR
ncbi:hypothetical protein FNV43_RR20981 [Rhamnella rubrinervis]|uniref:Uncharacterized protein n=1 Tax=Rhamnella rubrinervis TaxID=2594499 RepID=A0A8K0GXG8_9ROSA|nr:hypothetical protein FNV43_RR20981 [Rhamnella rubrinervis]